MLVLVLALVVLTGAGGGWLLYQQVRAEADVVFDTHLQEIAAVLRDQTFAVDDSAAAADTATVGRDLTRLEEGLVIQVFDLDGTRVYLSRPRTHLPEVTRLGFSNVRVDGTQWRIFGIVTPTRVIQVAQPLTIREVRAGRLVANLLLPFAALVLLLGLALAFGLENMLAPLGRLADGLAHAPIPDAASVARAIAAADTRRLPPRLWAQTPPGPSGPYHRAPRLPAELHTVVSALLGLLARLDAARARERAFIADAAHELRTPLASLAANAQNLAARASGTPLAPDVERLEHGVGRAARLVQQMLALSRLGAEPGDQGYHDPEGDGDTPPASTSDPGPYPVTADRPRRPRHRRHHRTLPAGGGS